MDECDFIGLGYTGVPFTWYNGQSADANVKIRLDRMLVNPAFGALYGCTVVRHAPSPKSDHCMLITKIRKSLDEDIAGGPRPFMYEDAWRKEESYAEAVLHGWPTGAGMAGLAGLNNALSQMQVCLTDWSSKKFGDVRKKIKKVQKMFERKSSLYRGISQREKVGSAAGRPAAKEGNHGSPTVSCGLAERG